MEDITEEGDMADTIEEAENIREIEIEIIKTRKKLRVKEKIK